MIMKIYKMILSAFIIIICSNFAYGAKRDNVAIFNPSVFEIYYGEKLFKKYIKTENNLSTWLGIPSKNLKKFLSTFPRSIKKQKKIITLKQMLQKKIKKKLTKDDYRHLLIYLAYLSNNQSIKNNDYKKPIYKKAIKRGKRLFNKPIGKMGYACVFCHKLDGKQDYYKSQQIPQLISNTFANKWPAYSMQKGYSISMQEKIKEHLKDFGITNKQINQNDITNIILYIKSNNQDKKQITPSFSK